IPLSGGIDDGGHSIVLSRVWTSSTTETNRFCQELSAWRSGLTPVTDVPFILLPGPFSLTAPGLACISYFEDQH
ncbi:unnamed protein product, partial [Fusarium graminearum]